ncbi:hypothetical protein WESB_0703 [Brachyspira pilosicoli WesB]|uniref:Uncharacterized protein n=1 Tax=Brachyspira pilosicoli WesB TaxID=1161918 RepID=K0JFB7_BRAPL|nr:RES domain-containing protein [Brachyspira pilosicoli]CCG56173.1 hypothetical protein WESB_0703 [Brachyspira pilosicoli WesB]
MSCIYCFFSKENQMKLKKDCFGNPRYEETLKEYKKIYIDELKKINTIEQCECSNTIRDYIGNDNNKINLCFNCYNDFLVCIKNHISDIEKYFDEIIDIYDTYIKENIHIAYEKMKNFIIKIYKYRKKQTIFYSTPMFRVRPKGQYNIKDIREYFHIPFNKRFLTSNQRFSTTGKPMIYLSNSLQIALAEVNKKIDEVNAAIFLPSFSYNYDSTLYDIKNDIIDLLKNIISSISSGIKYDDKIFQSLFSIFSNHIFYNILTFPIQEEYRGPFIQEYVLPQLLTDILKYDDLNNDYIGIEYQSTKEYKWKITDMDMYQLESNYCFFIPYEDDNDYSNKFLERFFYYCDTENIISNEDFLLSIESLKNINLQLKNEGYNNSDIGLHLFSIKNHINDIVKYKGNDYYLSSNEGKIERTLIYGLIQNIIKHVYYLKNNNLIKKINEN